MVYEGMLRSAFIARHWEHWQSPDGNVIETNGQYWNASLGAYTTHNATDINEGVGALPLKPEAGARPVQRHLEGIEKIVKEFIAE